VYPLAGLLKLRGFREEAAQKALRAAEAEARTAAETLAARERRLEEYKQWHREERERRWLAILDQTLSRQEMDEFKAGLALLEELELAEAEAVREAALALDKAQQKVQAARAAWRAAEQARRKLSVHREEWEAEQAREAVRREDLELEEFKPRPAQAAEEGL
jgi:type III secretion protein O